MQMYFEIKDVESVAKIDNAIDKISRFDEKLYSLQKKYGSDKTYVFNSIDFGIEFSCLWFEEYPRHLDTKNNFKISCEKHKKGWEVRPRKANKKFYSEFMSDLVGADYSDLKLVLFGEKDCRPNISYLKKDDAYYIDSTIEIVVPCRELIASEYKKLTEKQG